ncbi:Hypothetical predicted protein [Olea europaea subsp. europaea]|uniref:Uncharacterized protein n=1 Tax=Olea europaea subsp. europaea TaxID=158383 RepID=A0A8S0UNQ7_OLEEU|nr:Hypothetical predicted protein [Olea europaea subsp. europaea]
MGSLLKPQVRSTEYDSLGMYWRVVAYNEVFKRLAELYLKLDLTSVKDEFILTEPSTPANEEVVGGEDVD